MISADPPFPEISSFPARLMIESETTVGQLEHFEEEILDDETVAEQIEKIKQEKNAIILAHNYQPPVIQDIADFTGDSLGLSRKAAETDADIVVFCGAHFMAETAHILSPQKIVLLPDMSAGCPLAEMADPESVLRLKKENPRALVVSYVNTTAAVKAVSDYCCTSANAVRVVEAVESETVIFVPDRNLAAYVGSAVEKEIIPYPGFCPVHEEISAEQVLCALNEHPGSEVIAHPECREEVLRIAHHIRSTSGMVDAALSSSAPGFIVATEEGMLYPLMKQVRQKRFYTPIGEHVCPDMKRITLSKVLWALQTLKPRVVVPEEVRSRALRSVERMLAIE